MNRYREIVGKVNYGLFLTVVALLPFEQLLLRYACVMWIICWVLEGRWLQRLRPLRENKMLIPFLLFGLWYLWQIVSWFWVADRGAWSWQMERYMTFGLLIPVGLWGVNKCYDWRTVGKVLVASCVIAVPFYLTVLTVLYYHPELIGRLPRSEEWYVNAANWYSFYEENISVLKHRLFLCSVELFGAVVAYQLWHKRPAVFIPILLVMLSSIPLTGSRQSILTAAGIMAVALVYELPKMYRLRYGVGILLLGVVLGFGVLKLHPRMQNFDFTDFTEMREIKPDHNVRLNIWGVALQHPSDYIGHGLGAGQSTQYMVQKYKEANMNYYAHMHYHAHNQYLEEVMEIGIPGLLLFLLAWISIPLCARGQGVYTALLFTTIFVMNMLTDCMFGKFCGIALWAVGLILILLQSDPESEEQTSRDAQAH